MSSSSTRAFSVPVTALLLPFAITSLDHVFQLAGGCLPEHAPLKVVGIAPFDVVSRQFYPVHKAVLRVYPAEEDALSSPATFRIGGGCDGYDDVEPPEPLSNFDD